jgi:hypothetical protein
VPRGFKLAPRSDGDGAGSSVWQPDRRNLLLLTLCILLHAVPFFSRPALIGGDEPHYALMAHSIAVDGSLDPLPGYRRIEAGSAEAGRKFAGKRLDRHLATQGSRQVFIHPFGLPALAAPFVGVLAALSPQAPPDLVLGGLTLTVTFLALLAGWSLLVGEMGNVRDATILAFGLYFSTPLWYYSRTFFTEPYMWSFVVLGVWCVTRRRWLAASLMLAFACVMKETAVLLVIPIGAFVWRRQGFRSVVRLAPFPLLFAVAYFFKNWFLYGRILVTFQPYGLGDPLAGTLGVLFDSRHGLLPFAPVLILAVAGWAVFKPGRRSLDDRSLLSLAAFLAWFAVTACWVDWRGGSCYGPRLMVPAIMALVLPICRCWQRFADDRRFRVISYALIVLGFAIQWRAGTKPFAAFWSISLSELLFGAPIATLAGLVVGGMLLWFLPRLAVAARLRQPVADSEANLG